MTLLFLLACTPDDLPPTPPEVSLTVGDVPMVPTLTWSGSDGATIRVDGSDTAPGDPSAGIPVFGLTPATDYDLIPVDADGTELPPVAFRTPDLPDGLSRTSVESNGTSTLGDGLVAVAVAAEFGSHLALVDADGIYRWWFTTAEDMTVASPAVTLDGTGIWFAQHDRERIADRGIATRLSWDGRDRLDVRTPRAHHKLVELPDGRIAYLAHTTRAFDVDGVPRTILTDRIERVDPALVVDDDPYETGEVEPEVVFDFFDTTAPWSPCPHADRAIDKWDYTDVYEWTHSNSLVHDADEGLFYLMSWHLDALLAIDDGSGEVVWQLGGRDATRAFAEPARGPFDHAHTSWVDADQAWVFDNRVHWGGASRLVHYDLSEEPVTIVQTIFAPDYRHVGFLGDVQPAPEGHVLGGWTVPGDVAEYDADGNEVWRVLLGPGTVLGRMRYVERPW